MYVKKKRKLLKQAEIEARKLQLIEELKKLSDQYDEFSNELRELGHVGGLAFKVNYILKNYIGEWQYNPKEFMQKMGYMGTSKKEISDMVSVDEEELDKYESDLNRGKCVFNMEAREKAIKEAFCGSRHGGSQMLQLVLKNRMPDDWSEKDKKQDGTPSFQNWVEAAAKRMAELPVPNVDPPPKTIK